MRLLLLNVSLCLLAILAAVLWKVHHHHPHQVPTTDVATLHAVAEAVPRPTPNWAASRSRAVSPPKRIKHRIPRRGVAYKLWANSTTAIKVANCESGDRHSWDHYNGSIRKGNGSYFGKWAMGLREWRDTGGTGNPARASEDEQDLRAYKLYQARGWSPWSCAKIMHII